MALSVVWAPEEECADGVLECGYLVTGGLAAAVGAVGLVGITRAVGGPVGALPAEPFLADSGVLFLVYFDVFCCIISGVLLVYFDGPLSRDVLEYLECGYLIPDRLATIF